MTEASALGLRLYGIVSANDLVKMFKYFVYAVQFQNWQLNNYMIST